MRNLFSRFREEFSNTSKWEKWAFGITLASYVPLVIGAGDIVLLPFIYWVVLAVAVIRVLKFHDLPYLIMFGYIVGDCAVILTGLSLGGNVSLFSTKNELLLLSFGFATFVSSWWYLEVTGKSGWISQAVNAVALQISYVPLIQAYAGPEVSYLGAVGIGIANAAMFVQLFLAADFVGGCRKNVRKAVTDNVIWIVGIVNSSVAAMLMTF